MQLFDFYALMDVNDDPLVGGCVVPESVFAIVDSLRAKTSISKCKGHRKWSVQYFWAFVRKND